MIDSDRIDALLAVCAGLEARIAQMEQAHKADRERLNRLEGRESRAQNLSGDVKPYLDMADAPAPAQRVAGAAERGYPDACGCGAGLQRAEGVLMGWIPSTTKLHPDKPGLANYEQIRCLVVHQGDVLIRWWNCEHKCWDDEQADDHFCDAADVTAWMLAPEPPPVES